MPSFTCPPIATEQLNVAVSLFYWAARTGKHKKLLKPFLLFKLARYNRISKRDYPKLCADFLKAGFAHADNDDFIFLYNLDHWRGKRVVVKANEITRLSGTALAFAIIQENMLALSKETRVDADPRKGKNQKRHLTSSVHNGGIALSLIASVFGYSKSWASLMRKEVSDAGLCSYRHRIAVYEIGSPEWNACFLEHKLKLKVHSWKSIDGKYRKEITSACDASFFEFKRARKAIRRSKLKCGKTMIVESPLRVLLKPKKR